MIWAENTSLCHENCHQSRLSCIKPPKSLLVFLIDVLIYGFHTHFDQGLKARRSPQCSPPCSFTYTRQVVIWTDELNSGLMPMWETTFPRNSHAGLGRDFTKMFHTHEYVRFVKLPTKSGVAISRKCCFPHGLMPRRTLARTPSSALENEWETLGVWEIVSGNRPSPKRVGRRIGPCLKGVVSGLVF